MRSTRDRRRATQQNATSFNPSQTTDPEHAKDMVGQDSLEYNLFEFNAANTEVSSMA